MIDKNKLNGKVKVKSIKRVDVHEVLSVVTYEEERTKVDVKNCAPSLNLKLTAFQPGGTVIAVRSLTEFGSGAAPSENPSGAKFNKLSFYLSRRVRDR